MGYISGHWAYKKIALRRGFNLLMACAHNSSQTTSEHKRLFRTPLHDMLATSGMQPHGLLLWFPTTHTSITIVLNYPAVLGGLPLLRADISLGILRGTKCVIRLILMWHDIALCFGYLFTSPGCRQAK